MSQRADIIAIAKSQIGYREGANNNNKYGAAFNANHQPWCAYFIAWCAKYAKIPTEIIPASGYVPAVMSFYDNRGLFKKRGSYQPKKGDLIIFDFNRNGVGDHIGVVSSVTGAMVYSIEGNTSKAGESGAGDGVWNKGRSINYSGILGYCLPRYEEDEQVDVKKILIKHSDLGMIEVDAVNIADENYVRLRDTEKIAPIVIGWNGKNPTVDINYPKK